MCKVYCGELGQYMMLFDALEKKCNETANYSRVVTNGHQYTKTIEDGKFICWINTHTPIKKQSNQD